MTGLVDPEEVQVANRLELSVASSIHSVLGKLGRLELACGGVVDGVHNKLASVPVADPICKRISSEMLQFCTLVEIFPLVLQDVLCRRGG